MFRFYFDHCSVTILRADVSDQILLGLNSFELLPREILLDLSPKQELILVFSFPVALS